MTADSVGGVWTYACELIAAVGEDADVVLAVMGPRPNTAQRRRLARLPLAGYAECGGALEWMEDPWDDVARAGSWLLELQRAHDAELVHLNGFVHASLPFGVPVVVVGQAELPGFYARSLGVRAPSSVPDVDAAARLAGEHLGLGLGSAVLVCVPVPAESALPADVTRRTIDQAIGDADDAGIAGPELTPWLLARIAALTRGASVRANTALIVNNAAVGARIAVRMRAGAAAR
jgi:hypothetical protein